MKLKIPFGLAVVVLACCVSTAKSQKAASLLDQIAASLPQMDSEWKHKATEAYKRADGCTQASIKWSNGEIDQGATVIIHPTLKSARLAFRRSGKEDLQDDFRIDGIGDEAFLWPPKAPQGGAFNIRFRKGLVEVWLGTGSEIEVRRYGLAIVAALATTNKRP